MSEVELNQEQQEAVDLMLGGIFDLVAGTCHTANKAICDFFGDQSQVEWKDAPEYIHTSAIAGIVKILNNPDIQPQDLHAAWAEHKVADGWVYGEIKDAEKKTHPCLCDYEDLPMVDKFKDFMFLAIAKHLTKQFELIQ